MSKIERVIFILLALLSVFQFINYIFKHKFFTEHRLVVESRQRSNVTESQNLQVKIRE